MTTERLSGSVFTPRGLILVGLAATVLVSGCATKVTVDSLAKPNAQESISYRLETKNPLGAADSLREQEAREMVKTALAAKGMYEAPENASADLIIRADYGIGPPQIRRDVVSQPVYLKIPGSARDDPLAPVANQGRPAERVEVQTTPTGHFGGYQDVVVMKMTYEKYLRLTAVSPAAATEGRPPPEIWTIDVTSEGPSSDLREQLPVLAAASIEYIGKDSKGQRTIRIKDLDQETSYIKEGMKLVSVNGRR